MFKIHTWVYKKYLLFVSLIEKLSLIQPAEFGHFIKLNLLMLKHKFKFCASWLFIISRFCKWSGWRKTILFNYFFFVEYLQYLFWERSRLSRRLIYKNGQLTSSRGQFLLYLQGNIVSYESFLMVVSRRSRLAFPIPTMMSNSQEQNFQRSVISF